MADPVVQGVYDFKLQAIETPIMDQDLGADPTITHELKGDTGTPTGSNAAPPIQRKYADKVLLAGGAKTIDLTALDDGNLPDIDFTTFKVQLVKIRALASNTQGIKIKKGATNGYGIFGANTPEITLEKGDIAMYLFNDSLADVSATEKTIDLTGNAAEGVEMILIAG